LGAFAALFLPKARLFFCRHEGSVDEYFPNIDPVSLVQILFKFLGDAYENFLFDLLLVPPVACLV